MVIDPNNSISSQNLGANKARQQQDAKADASIATQNVKTSNDGDSVSLSNESRAIASLESRVLDAPDVDTARVAELKQAIDSGSYRINVEAIADKVVLDETQLSAQ